MTRPSLELRPLADHPIDVPAAVMNRAFEGYIGGDMTVTPALFAHLSAANDVAPALSRVAYENGEPVALALVARRGWRSRLAAMGVVPEAKGRGVGTSLLGALLEEARERGERTMELECFEQNTPGVRLYASAGFETRRRLFGYTGTIVPVDGDVDPADPAELAAIVGADGIPELPWQVSAPTLLKSGHPQRAYRQGGAFALVSESEERIQLTALVSARASRGRGDARRLLGALAARRPGATWAIAPLCPEEMASFFERLGLTRERLNQLHMTCAL